MAKRTNLRGGAPLSILFITIIAFALHSCTVKEMREACPCRVGLDFSNLLEMASEQGVIRVNVTDSEGKSVFFKEYAADTCEHRYEITLPKGTYTISSLLANDYQSWKPEEDGIRLVEGCQADSLYGEAEFLDALGEEAEAIPDALKQFAILFIKFAAPVKNLRMDVLIPTSFISSKDLAPLPSPIILSDMVTGKTAVVGLPRQCSEDIIISFFEGRSTSPILSINLSSRLKEIGYDFSAPSLENIYLSIDFNAGQARIEVEGWKDCPIFITF
jgi:hypothetical protein